MFTFVPNEYIIEGDFAIFKTKSGETFMIDAEDVDKIIERGWYINEKGYVISSPRHRSKLDKRSELRLHRLITDCPEGMVVDHINHDLTDNRKCNLRVCSQMDNMKNRKPDRKSKSGIKGVYPENGKWRVMISHNRTQYHLGTYSDINEAIRVRQEAERHLYGEFANIQEVSLSS